MSIYIFPITLSECVTKENCSSTNNLKRKKSVCENRPTECGSDPVDIIFIQLNALVCLHGPFNVMNVCTFPVNHFMSPGCWICFTVCTCKLLRAVVVECVDVFASQALIQKAHSSQCDVTVWNFYMRALPFTNACDIYLYIWCFGLRSRMEHNVLL